MKTERRFWLNIPLDFTSTAMAFASKTGAILRTHTHYPIPSMSQGNSRLSSGGPRGGNPSCSTMLQLARW